VLTGVDTVSDRPFAKPSPPVQIRFGPPVFPPQCLASPRHLPLKGARHEPDLNNK